MKKNRIALFILLMLIIIAAYFIFTNKESTIKEELRDFAVEDTASVDKIFMADKTGSEVILEKKAGEGWLLNGKEPARPDAINLLLYTLKAMEVRSPVGKAARENIIKMMSATAIKVELYQHNRLFKTFYVGGPTQDQLGTYMYLQNSTVPFIMHIPGFDGYLSPRFIVSEADWKIKSVFNYKRGEIANLILVNKSRPNQSFQLKQVRQYVYELSNYPEGKIQQIGDSGAINRYLSGYQFINYEKNLSNMPKQQVDSILNLGPMLIIDAFHTNGKETKVELFLKPANSDIAIHRDENGKLLPFDPDRMIARINNDTALIVVQYYNFDKLMVTLDALKNPEEKKK